MKLETKISIIGVVLGIIGFIIVGYNSNWYIPIGIFIMMFGNNLEQGLRFKEK